MSDALQCLINSAPFGVIGIDESLRVYSGFDGDVYAASLVPDEFRDDTQMSPEDKRALADRMIALWKRYREAV